VIDTEQAVISIILSDSSRLSPLTLSVDDFTDASHREIYAAFGELESESIPIDLVTVGERLVKKNKFDLAVYLTKISDYTPPGNFEFYVNQIKEKSAFRQYLNLGRIIQSHSNNGHRTVQEYIDEAIEQLTALKNGSCKNKERNLTVEIKAWIDVITGVFHTREIDGELQLKTKQEKNNRRKIIQRLVDSNYLKSSGNKSGYYCKVESDLEKIDFMSADPNSIYPIKFPFDLQNYVNLYPKNIVVVAGSSNAGKTALLLNTAAYNKKRHPVHYFSSEMGPEELRLRLSNFDVPLDFWEGINFWNRSFNFSDVIQPNALNIIDYLEITNDFFAVGGEIKAIFDKLDKGIAIIAIQKKGGVELGRGAEFTLEKARLYLSIDSGKLKIVKGKNWAQPGVNPNGKIFNFKLVGGCKFV
jgi:hypothetical protein